MEHYAGLDVSLKETSVCIVDGAGKIIRETKVASEPEALVGYFSSLEIKVVRIGLEAGPLSQWLYAALTQAGFEVVLLETRHVKAALSAMTVKTDRRDARGIAQLLRMGWYRPVHCKTLPSQEVRAIITARALTALTFKTAIDDPRRIAKARDVGPLFGLTPGRYQSGETDIIGRITKVGDVMVRTALFEAATVMLTRSSKKSRLKAWALDVAKRRGTKRAIVALARKL